MAVTVQPVPCLSDNYLWLLQEGASGAVAVCDPGEAAPAIRAVEDAGGRLDLVLLTHHHGDHIAGAEEVARRFGARIIGAAADAHRLPKLDQAVREGDTVRFGNAEARVIDTPGHTRGHIAFHFPEGDVLLCGDTLFSLGCGKLLEGTAEEMFHSLQKLSALPGQTFVCCGHEYTESNARFALTVEPNNPALIARAEEVGAERRAGKPTVPTRLAQELSANPFLRAGSVARLAEIRSAKDNFRG